jgi:hypothetical protein
MTNVLKLYSGRGFLGGRAVAHKVRTEAAMLLAADADCVVVLDFSLVDGVSHSFADELLSPLADMLSDDVKRRVSLANCSPSTLADLQSVADMHGLPMPRVQVAALS